MFNTPSCKRRKKLLKIKKFAFILFIIYLVVALYGCTLTDDGHSKESADSTQTVNDVEPSYEPSTYQTSVENASFTEQEETKCQYAEQETMRPDDNLSTKITLLDRTYDTRTSDLTIHRIVVHKNFITLVRIVDQNENPVLIKHAAIGDVIGVNLQFSENVMTLTPFRNDNDVETNLLVFLKGASKPIMFSVSDAIGNDDNSVDGIVTVTVGKQQK